MSSKIAILFTVVLLVGAVLLACAAPVASPASAPPVQPKAVEQPPAPAPAPQTSAADRAWQEVVSAAKKESKLTIYSYSMIGDVGLAVSEAFKKKYGISLDIVTGRGAEMAERIKTEQQRKIVTADLMDANPTQLYYLKEIGGTVTSSDIPTLREKGVWQVEPAVADKEGHILVHTLLNHTGFVNTRLVPAGQEPTSLAELAQPKWKGKILTMDPTFSSGQYILLGSLWVRKLVDEATLRAIGRNDLKLVVNAQVAASEIARGERAVQVTTAEISFAPMMREGAPVKAIAFKEGTVASGNALTAIRGAPHPNAARVFVNWLLSQEGQTVFLKAQSLSSPRSDVPDFRPAPAQVKPYRLIALTEEDEKENARLFREQFLTKLWKE